MITFTVHAGSTRPLSLLVSKRATKMEHILAIQAEKDTRPFVPAKTLSLANRTAVQGNRIIYPGPNSRYLYHGKLMVSPTTGSSYAKKGEIKVLTDIDLKYSHETHKLAQAHWFDASKARNLKKWLKIAGKEVTDGLT